MAQERVRALRAFHEIVESGGYPGPECSVRMDPIEIKKFVERLDKA